MNRILNPASILIGKRRAQIFIAVEIKKGGLSICGVEGPLPSGNCHGGCGQIDRTMGDDYIAELEFNKGWDETKFRELLALWRRWHLNDMQAGTPAQMAHLRTLEYPGGGSHYGWVKSELAKVGLEPDNGYRYGSSWLREELPEEVVTALAAFPESTVTPAWV